MRKILTYHEYPPISPRDFDWVACFEGDEGEQKHAFGRTEQEAINNLINEYEEVSHGVTSS